MFQQSSLYDRRSERMTARVYCAVLLCLSGCWSSTEAALGRNTANPGVCPSRKYKPGKCARISFVSCADDSECANNEKCCSNGCGLQCMAPVTANPGVCPSRKYKPGKCARIRFVSCADDSDCANNEKCCSNGCGLQCMAPVTAMDQTKLYIDPPGKFQVNQMPSLPLPRVCPRRTYKPGMCALIRFVPCADDSDCANNEKCCSNGCGLQCMASVTDQKQF
ncbi:uncharacterized protein LOC143722546 [Siphateles boraxobius]|uniref:uncharacterized protein LOC143722546 n=1 Tax=Siphateles boraxobius TaxID=180520 RepID=UPI00406482AB